MEISFYPGCTSHSTGLEYTLSIKAVFDALGVKLTEIEDWNCCGAAAAHSMSNLLGLALPARNIAKAQKRDLPLAVPCAGCFNAIKRAQNALENDPGMKKQLEDIIQFTYKDTLDVKLMHDVIFDHVGMKTLKKKIKKPLKGLKTVSYYGCALVRNPKIVNMGDHENPMFLDNIVDALGGEVVDWSFKTDCCSADLALSHRKIGSEIADNIAAMALEADADCIMASCVLCQINLDMRQTGIDQPKVPVLYFTEMIGIAMDLWGRDVWWDKHVVNPRKLLDDRNLL
jgi:heterodisulfide reductase subunit B